MLNSPIGIFDSGIGGISIFEEIKKVLPNENIIYLADNFNSPYGKKSKNLITKLSFSNANFLIEKGCKLIVVACNTATTNSIKELRSKFSIPFVGVEPPIKPASEKTKTGVIGVLATSGTLKSGLFNNTTLNYTSNVKMIEKSANGLVELIEKGVFSGEKITKILKKSLKPMIKEKIDILCLGCTHYPIIIDTIQSLVPNHVQVIHSGIAVAKQTKKLIKRNKINNENNRAQYSFYCNGSIDSLNKILNNKFVITKI
ncbi:MAG: glutamate racemase [Flavobacteriaceae bacterium]